MLASTNTILHERQLEEYYCTLCYAVFDFKRRTVTMANSGLPYPIRFRAGQATEIELPGVPLGAFAGSTYDEVMFDLAPGDVFVFCTDGVFEAQDPHLQEFGVDAAAGDRRAHKPGIRARDGGRHLRCRPRIPWRHAAERRHDGGGAQDHRVRFEDLRI